MYRFVFLLLFPNLRSNGAECTGPLPVRGLCIASPDASNVDEFVKFTDNELAQAGINLFILRVDFGYKFRSHPELVIY